MCDFFSSICRIDGTIFHAPHNSHSRMVEEAGWKENDQMADLREPRFVEVEWNGRGEYPGAESVARGTINEKQRKAIDLLYGNLEKLVSNPNEHAVRMFTGKGYFSGANFADVWWFILARFDLSEEVKSKIASLEFYALGSIPPLHPLPAGLTSVGGNLDVEGYSHPLPAGLTSVGGYLYVEGYSHPLPAGLTSVGGNLYVRGYSHPLPAGLKVKETIIR